MTLGKYWINCKDALVQLNLAMSKKKSPPSLEEWKQGVWNYLIEHSDVTDKGSLFVKFHTKSQHAFENHVIARVYHGYSRDDSRLNMTREEKEELHIIRRYQSIMEKRAKRQKYQIEKKARQFSKKYPKRIKPVVHRLYVAYATARIKMLQYTQELRTRGNSSAN